MMPPELVWLGRDNAISRQLLVNGAPVDLASYTAHAIRVGAALVHSDNAPAGTFTVQANGVLDIRLGNVLTMPGQFEGQVILYNAQNPSGLAWDVFPVIVRANEVSP